ncbi:hypothetical protein MNBD_NITROSPINAE04-1958 [hydrothermal vent metagenome]|uniref:Uncharacterized protein n=1 Tax=hydrothermal vent metagenome TaxID=652676 RepID=A0A3B1C9L5_9ZZZZ
MDTKNSNSEKNQETRDVSIVDSDNNVFGSIDSGSIYAQRNYVRKRLLPELRRYIARSGRKALEL